MRDLTAKQFAEACPEVVMTLAAAFVERTHEVPEGAVLDIWFEQGEVWADAGAAMYRLAYLSELLEDDTFVNIVRDSDDFLLFATNGDGN
jgi:hypothetical protein